jgi:hypothetical protein
MPKFNIRGFVSLLLSFSFLLIVASGLVLWQSPMGPGEFLGMSKGAWKHLHIVIALVMLLAGVVHLILNWSIYWCYLWNRSAKRPNLIGEFLLALAIAALIVVWSVYDHPNGGGPGAGHGGHEAGPGGQGGGPHGSQGVQQQNRYRGGHQ